MKHLRIMEGTREVKDVACSLDKSEVPVPHL